MWMKEEGQGSEKKFSITEPVCTKTNTGRKMLTLPPICQDMEQLIQPLEITGSTSNINLTTKMVTSEPEVEILDLTDNQYLIYAPTNTEATYKCPDEEDQVTTLEGLSTFSPALQCSLTIGAHILKHLPWERVRHHFFPTTLTFKSGHLKLLEKIIQSDNPTKMVEALQALVAHLQMYWPAYTATTIAVWGILVCFIIACIFRHKATKSHARVRVLEGELEEERGTTYVVERGRRP
jgi:hypothetical protein